MHGTLVKHLVARSNKHSCIPNSSRPKGASLLLVVAKPNQRSEFVLPLPVLLLKLSSLLLLAIIDMRPIQPEGTESETDVRLVSVTRNPETGETRQDEGWLCYKEIIVCHEGLHIATVLCSQLLIYFGGGVLIDINPKLRASYSDSSYHRIRAWITEAQSKMATRLLNEMPHVVPVNPLTEKPDRPTDFEDEMAGYQLFADMCDVKKPQDS